ncbi:phosphopantetheine adenylyltransferase [Algiphilus sp.]|uniref:phosphopantetheine adenylyltransferase n=1 Tax=Algiphilus sp. TaxID=1872431 RepID=UPI002A64F3CB|nr:phosphopantetheine adenylyltransferase [Pseudomonadota bacterium]
MFSPSLIVSGLLVAIGVIHLIPALGAWSPTRLQQLYGVAPETPTLLLLLRHRALLFALLGSFLVLSAFRPSLQPLACIAALISMAGFLWMAGAGPHDAAVQRIVRADIVGLVLLALAVLVRTLLIPTHR